MQISPITSGPEEGEHSRVKILAAVAVEAPVIAVMAVPIASIIPLAARLSLLAVLVVVLGMTIVVAAHVLVSIPTTVILPPFLVMVAVALSLEDALVFWGQADGFMVVAFRFFF